MHFMREFVADKDPAVPVSLGRKLFYAGKRDDAFLSGGCGQLLSRGAVAMLGENGVKNARTWLEPMHGPSDLMTSRTLAGLHIPIISSLDSENRNTFIVIGLDAEHTLNRTTTKNSWLLLYS